MLLFSTSTLLSPNDKRPYALWSGKLVPLDHMVSKLGPLDHMVRRPRPRNNHANVLSISQWLATEMVSSLYEHAIDLTKEDIGVIDLTMDEEKTER